MERCSSCKWWKQKESRSTVIVNAAFCTSPKVVFGTRILERDDENYETSPLRLTAFAEELGKSSRQLLPDEIATTYVVTDLLTGPEFGCVHHERN